MSDLLSKNAADVIGIIGSLCFLVGFAQTNMAAPLNYLQFNLLNLVGSILLLISLSVSFNLAAFFLEACWAVIALVGLVRAIMRRRAPVPVAP